jgi:hypothetical protein
MEPACLRRSRPWPARVVRGVESPRCNPGAMSAPSEMCITASQESNQWACRVRFSTRRRAVAAWPKRVAGVSSGATAAVILPRYGPDPVAAIEEPPKARPGPWSLIRPCTSPASSWRPSTSRFTPSEAPPADTGTNRHVVSCAHAASRASSGTRTRAGGPGLVAAYGSGGSTSAQSAPSSSSTSSKGTALGLSLLEWAPMSTQRPSMSR